MPIDLYFKPNSDKEVNFNLICNVRRKTLPVTLNVKAEGYSMDSTLLCEDSTGNRVDLTPNGLNQINFWRGTKGIKKYPCQHTNSFNPFDHGYCISVKKLYN